METLILEALVVDAKLDSSFELADFVGVSAPGAIHAMIRPSRRNNIALNADQWRVVKTLILPWPGCAWPLRRETRDCEWVFVSPSAKIRVPSWSVSIQWGTQC